MKAGLLKKVVDDYAPFFASPWVRRRTEFLRRCGPWLQIVSFNASRFDDRYVPRCGLDFLWMTGPVTGGLLLQELQENRTQLWVKAGGENAGQIYEEMRRQFRPQLDQPLDGKVTESELEKEQGIWSHDYALCLVAIERNDRPRAEDYRHLFEKAVADKPFAWVEERRAELQAYMNPGENREELRRRLRECEEKKLAALGVSTLPQGC